MAEAPTSILQDVEELFDRFLGCTAGQPPCYRSRTSYLRLRVEELDGADLLRSAYAQVCWNLANRATERTASKENWRWNPQPKMTETNPSAEKQLEKAVVRFMDRTEWTNQVPTASGVMGSGERHRNIDLIQCTAPGRYQFIELKVNSNHPLHAAVEMVCYGLIYLCSRRNVTALGYAHHNPLLQAEQVDLRVLAPSRYYRETDPLEQLRILEEKLNGGLETLSGPEEVRLRFQFDQFPNEARWTSKEEVTELLEQRRPVFPRPLEAEA